MRFFKMLLIAWAAVCLAQEETPSVESLGFAIGIAGVAWLFIRKAPPQQYRVFSRPSAAMIMIAGMSAVGNRAADLEGSGLTPVERLSTAHLSLAGLLLLLGLVGTLFVRYPGSESPVGGAEDAPEHPREQPTARPD
jgi:hypothetical protein